MYENQKQKTVKENQTISLKAQGTYWEIIWVKDTEQMLSVSVKVVALLQTHTEREKIQFLFTPTTNHLSCLCCI